MVNVFGDTFTDENTKSYDTWKQNMKLNIICGKSS